TGNFDNRVKRTPDDQSSNGAYEEETFPMFTDVGQRTFAASNWLTAHNPPSARSKLGGSGVCVAGDASSAKNDRLRGKSSSTRGPPNSRIIPAMPAVPSPAGQQFRPEEF
ncbi:hypothetical protein Bbelb_374770, partial [Branchiostoma belcheri]